MKKEKKKNKEKQPTYKSWWRDTFESIIIAALLALFLRAFALGTFKIPTGSMIPNLLIGDHLIVNSFIFSPFATPVEKFLLPQRDIKRGDPVVFFYPVDKKTQFVKRVIGLPGEIIEIRGKTVYIDGKPLDEPYAHFIDYSDHYIRPDLPSYKIPDENYFVMGDNRDNSNDSRAWGTVHRELVRGRPFLVYWSFDASTEEYLATGFQRIVNLGKTVINFIKDTRWERTFKIVN